MPLKSEALRKDPALQACLVRDPAHVVPGARGPHVSRIQKALILLDKANIPISELRGQIYGPVTAEAVLSFKQERRIVNFSYQTKADNIVGKMTIARLDEELFALEQQRSPGRTRCGPGGSGSGASAPTLAVTDGARPFRRRNAQISIIFQETDAAIKMGGAGRLLVGLFNQARKLMEPHGLDFSGLSGGVFGLVGPPVPDFEQVLTGSQASCFSVRAAAERAMPGRTNSLRVIFCPFTENDNFFGVTDGGTVSDWTFPKFCLINVRKSNPDQGTLLHEMIHAAKVEKINHDGDPRSVFSENVGGRDLLPAKHAESLANAYFSTVRL